MQPVGRSHLGEAPFPGWARLRTDLADCAAGGDELKLTAVEAMTILGEVDRLNARLDRAARILRGVAIGNGCWAVQQGYEACERRDVDEFFAGTSRRRLRWPWRR